MDDIQCRRRKQWTQLIALTVAHLVWDSFPGLMHTVLPAFQESFGLSVAAGSVLLTAFLIAANSIQLVVGHVRPGRDKPLFLYIGTLLTCAIILFWIVPAGSMALMWLLLISIVCGTGVGITHPEALRAIHRMDRISSAVSSSVFMAGGVIGFAIGGWGSTYLVTWWGFGCLIPFCVASVIALVLMIVVRIQLMVETDEPSRPVLQRHEKPQSFWLIMVIATLGACSMQLLSWIVPQHINEIGGNLTVGGLAVSIFCLSGGIGGIFISRHASRHGEMKLIVRMLMCGIPFVIAYLLLIQHIWSVALLSVGGFCCFGAYPLMVSAARHCPGLNFGGRMGLIVGGVWLVASVLPMLLGPVAKHFGTVPILFCIPIGFMLSLALAIRAKMSKPQVK